MITALGKLFLSVASFLMSFCTHLDVVRGTFFAFIFMQCSWTIWTFGLIFFVFLKAGIPKKLVGLLGASAALNCVGYLLKMVSFLTLSPSFGQLCGYFLILRVIFDVVFWIIIALSVDEHFGLYFYYDITLLTAVISALDMVLFPHFLLREHLKSTRKQK